MIKVSISIDVSDLKKAENFYIEALWCNKIRNQGSNMVVLWTDNVDIYLQKKESWTKPTKLDSIIRDYKRHWTPIHLDFLCDNVDERVKKVINLWWEHEGWESWEWGSIAYCIDPFGNGFCLINE